MKALTATAFALILSTSFAFAGNCLEHNKANLEAMSCQAGYTWDENAGGCVEHLMRKTNERAERSAPQRQHP